MKKIIKKNQVIITALAIMIAIAGYLSLTKDAAKDDKSKSVNKSINNESLNDDTSDGLDQSDILNINNSNDDEINSNNENNDIKDIKDNENKKENSGNNELGDSDELIHTGVEVKDNGELNIDADEKVVGEAVLVNSVIDKGYFFSSKLSREQNRSLLKASYEDIINNTNVSDKDKKKASNNLLRLLNNAEKENAAEILLSAKGFDGVVVSIGNETVDVIVNTESQVTDQQRAIIEDVIKRKTEVEVKDIVITPVVVHE